MGGDLPIFYGHIAATLDTTSPDPDDRYSPAEAFDHKAGSYSCFEEAKKGSPRQDHFITALESMRAKTAFFASV